MNEQAKIPGTAEAWESGELGQDERFVKVADPIEEAALNDALDLQLISIRLQKALIEDFKMIAKANGIGYQPLIRQVLKRFADSEKKRLIREMMAEREEREAFEEQQAKRLQEEAERKQYA